MTRIVRTVLGLSVASMLSACGASPTAVVDAAGRPTVLRYLHSPSAEEPEVQQSTRLERLKGYLSERLGIPVELHKTSAGYGVAIEAMRAGKVDVATFGPFGYLIAAEKAGAEAIVVRGNVSTGASAYRGTVAVAKDSPIRTIDEVIANAKALTFAFVDPASTSGYLIQHAMFASRGLDPDNAFKKTMFSVNHVASVMSLVAGKVDVAAVMEQTIDRLVAEGRMAPDAVRVIWTSPPMPASPIAVRKDLPRDFKRALQQALVDIPTRAPDLWAMWPSVKGGDLQVLLPAADATFDGLRAMARSVEHLSALEK